MKTGERTENKAIQLKKVCNYVIVVCSHHLFVG